MGLGKAVHSRPSGMAGVECLHQGLASRESLSVSLATGSRRSGAHVVEHEGIVTIGVGPREGRERPGAGPTGQLMRGGTTRTIVEPLVELPSASVAVNVTSVSPHG